MMVFFFSFFSSDMRYVNEGAKGFPRGPLTYDDYEPLTTLGIPQTLLTDEAEPEDMHEIYYDFLVWIRSLENINVYLEHHLRAMDTQFGGFASQLHALRLATMSEFFMRHPRDHIYVRREFY